VRPRAKVIIDSVVYEKSIGTKMNDFDLCLQVVSRSSQPLRHIRHWISRKPSVIEAWLQRTPIGNDLRESRDRWRHIGHERSNSWPQYAQCNC